LGESSEEFFCWLEAAFAGSMLFIWAFYDYERADVAVCWAPSLPDCLETCQFPESSAPNPHRILREFCWIWLFFPFDADMLS